MATKARPEAGERWAISGGLVVHRLEAGGERLEVALLPGDAVGFRALLQL
jgi:hypothetical protein